MNNFLNKKNNNLFNFGEMLSGGIDVVNKALSNGNKTDVGGFMQGIGSAASNIPGIGGLIGAGVQLLGGLTDSMFGSNLNKDAINNMQNANNNQSNYSSNASTNQGLLSDWGGFNILGNINQSNVGTQGWFSNAASNKTNELNQARQQANQSAISSFGNTASNISTQNQLQQMAQYYANGGKIHIKKANRGKFTSYCGGKVTSECIEKGKNSPNASTRKRAIFAQNARGWKHSNGGYLFSDGGNIHSGDSVFSNEVINIGNGGDHEENPNNGVPFGIDQDGVPNLVEQGEVVFNDYVFSKRILSKDNHLKEVGLPKKYKNKSYADIAKKISIESNERPNDPISNRGLFDSMLKLQVAQESQKEQDEMKQNTNKSNIFDLGGLAKTNIGKSQTENNTNQLSDYLTGYAKSFANNNPLKMKNELNRQKQSLFSNSSSEPVFENSLPSYLKYAPAVGSGIGSLTDLFGLTNKPDFDESNMVLSDQAQITPKILGNYMSYNPMDRDFYTNKLIGQSAASRRSIEDQSGGNRGAAIAGILASDYNTQNVMGNMFRQAEEYNLGQRQRALDFNRGTDMANAQSDMRAQEINSNNRRRALEIAAQMRMQEKSRSDAGKSANLTNLFSSLGEIGKEESNKDIIKWLENTGTLKSDMYKSRSKGGKIKRGYTY